ncbi:MAG: amidohydrolase [Clostridiales bacterium]|nr:amidohydrolase [Clostridiales bacterium]
MIVKNIKIYTLDSAGIIDNGYIEISGGKITAVGEGTPPATDDCVDGGGLVCTPGFIDAHTHLGIVENALAFEGDDCNEDSEPSTPHLRALDAINPLDICFAEARAAGITTAAVAPGSANPVGGQICVVKTYGKCVDKMLIKSPAAVKFALGENPKNTYHGKNLAPVTRMATAAIIRETLEKARRYADDVERAANDDDFDEPEYDMKNDALLPLMKGEIPAHFHAHRADDIFTAVRIAEEFGLKYVLVHCTEGHVIADELAELAAPAIVGPNLCDRSKPELINQTFTNPRVLDEAGMLISLTTDHPVTPLNYLPLCAALAAREGMSRESALAAITINPARILGVADRVGSIAVGKDADFVLLDGDPLSLETKVRAVYIDGKSVIS